MAAKGLKDASIVLDHVMVEVVLLRFDAGPFDAQAEPFVSQFRHEGMILLVAVPVIHGAARARPVHDQALLFPCPPVGEFVAALYLVAPARCAPDEVVGKVEAVSGQSVAPLRVTSNPLP